MNRRTLFKRTIGSLIIPFLHKKPPSYKWKSAYSLGPICYYPDGRVISCIQPMQRKSQIN